MLRVSNIRVRLQRFDETSPARPNESTLPTATDFNHILRYVRKWAVTMDIRVLRGVRTFCTVKHKLNTDSTPRAIHITSTISAIIACLS